MEFRTSGIELALLEGMSETLLLKLRDRGVVSRQALQQKMVTPEARSELARSLGVPQLQLDSIHYLNFVLPEERAARVLQQENYVRTSFSQAKRAIQKSRTWAAVGMILGATALVVSLFPVGKSSGPTPYTHEQGAALEDSVAVLRSQVEGLRPLAREQSRLRLAAAVRELSPAPGWYGPLKWSLGDHQGLMQVLGKDPGDRRLKAVSLAFRKLNELEDPRQWQRPLMDKAADSAALLREFPPLNAPQDGWDLAVATIRLRLGTRAVGLADLENQNIDVLGARSDFWTGHAFAPCEALLLSLENLPVRQGAESLWLSALPELRHQANLAKDTWGGAPQGWAREYWVLRGDLELAVVAAILELRDLSPYFQGSPKSLLRKRIGYLRGALAACPPAALEPLSWLRVEFEEARTLVAWLGEDPGRTQPVQDLGWLEALTVLEKQRREESPLQETTELKALVQAALQAGRYQGAMPFLHPRTQWETGLRPMFMETRRRATAQFEAASSGAS